LQVVKKGQKIKRVSLELGVVSGGCGTKSWGGLDIGKRGRGFRLEGGDMWENKGQQQRVGAYHKAKDRSRRGCGGVMVVEEVGVKEEGPTIGSGWQGGGWGEWEGEGNYSPIWGLGGGGWAVVGFAREGGGGGVSSVFSVGGLGGVDLM